MPVTIELSMLISPATIGLIRAGPGINGTSAWLASLGLRPARFWALLAGRAEFRGGICTALGLFHRLGPWRSLPRC
jgi:uncharacterized membrane protein YphA (DoxX/SURF4 family)